MIRRVPLILGKITPVPIRTPYSGTNVTTPNNNNNNNNNNNRRAAAARRNKGTFVIIIVTFGLIILAGWRLHSSISIAQSGQGAQTTPFSHGHYHDHQTLLATSPLYNSSSSISSPQLPSTYHTVSFRPVGKIDSNVSIITTSKTTCRNNAIVILAQKRHATYDRDSYGLLVKSLTLLSKNYLNRNNNHDHAENVDVFLFHTGDFDWRDVEFLEPLLTTKRKGILKLVNLDNSVYWTLPPWHAKDNQTHWKGSDIFPLGYRHMCRWFGIKIWNFFEELNIQLGCTYRHILRIDEDSFILSPIDYDIFDYMKRNEFVYGFRMCAYEMEYNRYIAPWLMKWKAKTASIMKREITRDMCGFYNNFFVADLQFFTSPPVREYLQQIHRQGFIYRKRYGDLMIHTTAVYTYADPDKIHRFLDFTYQHVTTDHILHPEQGCVVWGGIQAGYHDENSEQVLSTYLDEYVLQKKCTANVTYLEAHDLSPTYQHLPDHLRNNNFKLKTIVAGRVELPNQGILSG